MYRAKEERSKQRQEEGSKSDKTSWFGKLGYDNIIMLPATVDGELTNKVKKALDDSQPPLGFRTLVLEDGGRSLKSDLVRSNPFPRLSCQREDCLMCQVSPSRGKCSASNMVYSIECNRSPCNDENSICTPTYIGETSRSCRVRGSEHLTLYRNGKDNSFMHKHMVEKHSGIMGENKGIKDFKMESLNRFKGSLTRIVEEAVRIKEVDSNPKLEMMNSKIEYFGPQYVRTAFSKGPADRW